jgi:hypothetical protein
MSDEPKSNSEIVLYQTEDGRTRLEVRLEHKSGWLTQAQMAELFQTTIPSRASHRLRETPPPRKSEAKP